jgi:hypothetical protein
MRGRVPVTSMRIIAAATAAMFLVPSSAGAAVSCQGTVNKVIMGPDGDVYVDFGYNRLKICIMDATTSVDRGAAQGGVTSITPLRCQALYTAFSTALATGKPLIAYVDRTDCNFADGAIPNPYPYHFYFLK